MKIDNNIAKTFYPLKKLSEENFYSLKNNSDGTGMRINTLNGSKVDEVDAKKATAKKAATGVEAIFIRQLLSIMRETVPEGGLFGNGPEKEIYDDMMDNAIAEKMSQRNTFGIADRLYKQMVKEIDQNNSVSKNNENQLKN